MTTGSLIFLAMAEHGLAARAYADHGRDPLHYARKLNTNGRWAVHSKVAPFLAWPYERMNEAEACAHQCGVKRGRKVELVLKPALGLVEGVDFVLYTSNHEDALARQMPIASATERKRAASLERLQVIADLAKLVRAEMNKHTPFACIRTDMVALVRERLGVGMTMFSLEQWTTGQQAKDALLALAEGELDPPAGWSVQELLGAVTLGCQCLEAFRYQPMAMPPAQKTSP